MVKTGQTFNGGIPTMNRIVSMIAALVIALSLCLPVWAEESHNLTLCDLEADIVHRKFRAVIFDQILNFYHIGSHFLPS